MIIDNIIVITVVLILIIYLAINYIKKYAPINIVLISLIAFSLGIYVPIIYYGVYLQIRYQIPLFSIMFGFPMIVAILQYYDISFETKLLYKSAKKYYLKGKYIKCIQKVQRLIKSEGKKAEYIFLLGKCFKSLEDYEKARENFALTVDIDSNNYNAYYELGSVLEKEGNTETADLMYEKSLEINPSFYDAYETLGISLASQGRYEEAERLYQKALNFHENSYELMYNIAMVELELGNTFDAEDHLEEALSINSGLLEAIYSLANIKFLKGNYNEALALYSELVKTDEFSFKSYYKIAMIYVTKNEFDKAMGIIEFLIESDEKYISMIENEFVFNAMRSKIDSYLNTREININEMKEIPVIEAKREKKNWFAKSKFEDNDDTVLYNDIDITRTGFRESEVKKD